MSTVNSYASLRILTEEQGLGGSIIGWWTQHCPTFVVGWTAHQHIARRNGEFGETVHRNDLSPRFLLAHEVQP